MNFYSSNVGMKSSQEKQLKEFGNSILDFLDSSQNAQRLDRDSEKPIVKHMYTHQLTCVKDGEGWAFVGGNVMPINKGDIVFVSKGREHSFFTSDKITLFHMYWPMDHFDEKDRVIVQEEVDVDRLLKGNGII